ncbi:MAG: hypothetical protein WAW52_01740 [Methanothrix sp.]
MEYALKNNVPVPPEVLLNYPDLAAKTAKNTEAMFDFNNGDKVPLDSLGDVTLTHNDTLPVPDDVQALIDQAETYRFDNKQAARNYVQWVIDGEKGEKPNVPQSIIDDYANSLDILRNHARDKSKGIPTQTATAKIERAPDLVDQIRKRKSETNKSTTESYQWLIDRAIEDARANKDAALLEKLSKLDVDRLPESDLNMLNQLVLGYGGEKVTPTDTLVQKVYRFNHGDTPCVANVYKDGRLVAYLPETPLPDTKINDSTRILGLDPLDPNRWVYEIDGEIKSVDTRKPTFTEEQPSGELNQKGQGDLFSQSAEDLPLFSGTAPRAQDELFAPRPESGQMGMFGDLVPEAKPTRIIEIAVKENGSTSYVRIDLKRTGVIRQTLALHQGETMTARILDANGKVIASNVDPNDVVSPKLGSTLFQVGIQTRDRSLTPQEADFLATALVRQGEKAIEFALDDEPTRSGKVMILDAVHKIDAQMAERVARKIRTSLFQEANDAPMGSVPLNGTPALEPYARTLDEVNSEMIRPMLQDMRRSFKEHMGDQQVKWGDVSAAERAQIKQYLKGTVTNDLASTKLAALNYGDSMRNGAMLDYSRRYGFDNVLGTVFPYQFWYTRSMINWAKRMVDKPSWFAMYTRYQQTQQKMARDGMPTRLKGKVRIDMPWMPEWMGGGLWIDPVNKLFPFDQFGQPLEQFQMNKNQVDKRAEQIIDEMRQGEAITPTDAKTALETRAGSAWDRAVKQAELELDKSASPSSMASMMMQPALWWQVPGNIAAGTPEKIGTLPITRTGQTIRDLGKNTFLQTFTDALGGALAGPEEAIRKSAGLSEFGQWGDYYLDRTLAGMAADGEISADQARIAMIQRSGADYEEAYQRVVRENSLKTPGAAGIVAAKEGANPGQVLKATLTGIFGGSLFSEGELKMRGLKPIYDNAWRKLDAGDTEAINKFFDDYPEYSARLALYDKPEERLHQFLVDSIWQRYMDLEPANRRKVAQTLGDDFENSFLNKETRSYDALDDKTLASWAQVLGSQLPEVNELKGTPKLTAPEYYSPAVVDAVNAFQEERKTKYPSYNAWQSAYYELPAGAQRKAFLAQHPQLKAYWTWKDAYTQQHPEISQYFEDQKDAESTAAPAAKSSGTSGSRTIKLTQKAAQLTIQAFKDERTAKFPDYKAYQDQYYLQPSDAAKKAWLAQNPYLQSYWDWKDQYAVAHPEIQPYYDQLKAYAKQQTDTEASAIEAQFSSELTAPLIRSILAYATGGSLSAGAKSELDRIRQELAPEMTEDEFLRLVLGSVAQ